MSEDIYYSDDETDPDVKKSFFKEHFDFVDSFNNSDINNNIKKKYYIYLVNVNNITFYFKKKKDALSYIKTIVDYMYNKLYEKYKGIKDVFLVEDYSNIYSNTSIYTRNKNYLFSYDNLEYKIAFIKLEKN
jgi:hypothetical protein